MTSPPGYDPSVYPHFAVTVDIVVFTIAAGHLQVVVIERGGDPFKGRWALPGGFVEIDEDLDEAATRELAEETGVGVGTERLHQVGAYGAPGRDPRIRVVSVGYWTALPDLDLQAGDDAARAFLVPVDEALNHPNRLAFDQHQILSDARAALESTLETTTAATDFLPQEFTLTDLRNVYETVWGDHLDPGNFTRRLTSIDGFLTPTGKRRAGSRGRSPELYRAGSAKTTGIVL